MLYVDKVLKFLLFLHQNDRLAGLCGWGTVPFIFIFFFDFIERLNHHCSRVLNKERGKE